MLMQIGKRDARHISMVEQPDIFNRIMQDWLSSMR